MVQTGWFSFSGQKPVQTVLLGFFSLTRFFSVWVLFGSVFSVLGL
jgi:hypothetical protein